MGFLGVVIPKSIKILKNYAYQNYFRNTKWGGRMAVLVKPLSITEINNAKPKEKDYSLSDGQGLFLLVNNEWFENLAIPIL